MTKIDLSGKKILITGASQGIGKALAGYAMEMGARVAVHYNKHKKQALELISAYPETGSQLFKANLENMDDVEALFEQVVAKFSKIDAFVLNAGVYKEHRLSLDSKAWMKVWNWTMDINLNSVGLLTKLGIDHFRKHNGGRFIYIGSRAAFRGETEEFLAYAASKGGLTSLARTIARSFGKDNIKSFVVSPGFTRTKMADEFIQKYGEDRILKELSLNDLTEPEDLAPLVALMCSGLMDHATGATIDVNAGSHIR